MSRKSPSVVLVGRPNVGKSTLFNRMTGTRRAIVAPMAGTTRDALARPVVWRGTSFQLFDTGGMYGASEDPLHELVVQQGQRAIAGADLLVLVVDGREGLVPGDERIARELRETGHPGDARDQQDRRQALADVGDGVLPARLRAGHRDLRRARHRRRRSARRDRRARLEGLRAHEGSGLRAQGSEPERSEQPSALGPQP